MPTKLLKCRFHTKLENNRSVYRNLLITNILEENANLRKKQTILEIAIKSIQPDLKTMDENGRTLIGMIVENNLHSPGLIQKAIEDGVDLMMPISRSNPEPIAFIILKASDIESRRVVIKHLDNINHYAFGIWGTTFLHWLVEKNLTNIVREAADISQKIDKLNNSLETPLHLAAKQGNLQMVTHLLYNGANVNAVDFCGNTPLHVAVTMVGENHSKIIQMILRFRPEIDKRNQESLTPLMVLCKNLEIAEQVESVFLLMISGASVLIGHTTYTIDDRAVTAIDYAYAQVLKYYFEKNETSMKISTKAMHFLCLKIFIELSGTSEDCRRSDYDGFFERDVPFYKKVDLPIYIKKAIENSKKVKLGSKTLWHIAFFSIEKISVFFSDFSMKKAAETCVVRTGSRLLDIWLKKKISIATKRCNYVYACLSREVYLQLQFMEKVFQNWNEDSQWYVFICNTRKYTIPNECYICAL